ncbi:aminotransferase class V-fold PLP-dependent enzyme [Aurantiacibacter sp. MUD11]|uniref:cysteine desulfurase family protein n=1 Tax=Aurantiacibacter sp. MUD11 TaxID=3003265 RepID=UPI0022AA52E3|nr:aminotransferase class V-fold PLP-dependent enzyme [Aurantiacibacter sp. MUD11]WAT18796.1 aminotransferase class V-fold PLP-dependent enzyme [Aurantiacibacter sp. MUD11]
MSRIYLDHAATTPLRPEAKAAMDEGFAIWANPSSPHAEGRKAKAALEDARERVKTSLGWEGEVIFTSGASEAARTALENTVAPRKCALPVEHDALMVDQPGMYDAIVPMPPGGLIGRSAIYDAFGPPDPLPPGQQVRALFACQHVNSETGTRFGADGFAVLAHYRDAIVLSDCSQSAGKLPLPDGIDMAIVSAHKLGGPIGVGALLVRDYKLLKPSGGHERGYRRGTENLPDILGMAAALENRDWCTNEAERAAFAARLGENVLKLGENQVDYILPLAHPSLSAQALLIRLDAMGFAVSAGSACSSGTLKKSRVLDAFGVPDDVASRTIRVSLGWSTTVEELDAFADAWKALT